MAENNCDQNKIVHRIDPIPSLHLMESCSSSNRAMSIFIDDRVEESLDQNNTCCVHVGIIHKNTFLVYYVSFLSGKLDDESLKYEYKQTIQIIPQHDHGKEVCTILQAKWLRISQKVILVISTKRQLLFYDDKATKLLGQFDESTGDEDLFSKPIRAVTSIKENIFTGSENGCLCHFKYETTKSMISLETVKKDAHKGQIYDACTDGIVMASGDSQGNISIWNILDLTKIVQFQTNLPECVTNCVIWSHFVIGSYETGVIRIYDLNQQYLTTLIRAHSRWIASMDLSLSNGTLLTISEDNQIRIWQLEESKVRLKSSFKLINQVPLSGKFLNKQGTILAVSCFASKEMLIFKA